MKSKAWSLIAVAILTVGLLGCSAKTPAGRDAGGVILSITDFDGLPIQVGVNALANPPGFIQIDELTIQNIAANPTGPTSTLMDVELLEYQVGFSRADQGTRTPRPSVRGIFGLVPVNGNNRLSNLPIMSAEEFTKPPLSDLLFENGAEDSETGSEAILLNIHVKFFGRTLGGTNVETPIPAQFVIQFIP